MKPASSRKLSRLLLVPAAAVALYYVGRLIVPADAVRGVDVLANLAGWTLGTIGCFAASRAFERGDYLRTAWDMQAASCLVLLGSAILRLVMSDSVLLGVTSLTMVANLIGVIGTVIFARAHRVAGLELPWSRGARMVFIMGICALAAAAAGPSIVVQIPRAQAGDLEAWTGIFSSLGDLLVLALIAPVFMTAVALRGGLLLWPWGLFTAAGACWLVYDAQDTLIALQPHLDYDALAIVTSPLRLLATTLLFASGMAQRYVTLGSPEVSSS